MPFIKLTEHYLGNPLLLNVAQIAALFPHINPGTGEVSGTYVQLAVTTGNGDSSILEFDAVRYYVKESFDAIKACLGAHFDIVSVPLDMPEKTVA